MPGDLAGRCRDGLSVLRISARSGDAALLPELPELGLGELWLWLAILNSTLASLD